MNDQNPIPDTSTPPPGYRDWREQRRAGRHYGWIGGPILILLGVALLLQNMGVSFLANWWALFLLIPAFWAFVAAWECYQNNGRLTGVGARSLAGGILLTILAVVSRTWISACGGRSCLSWAA